MTVSNRILAETYANLYTLESASERAPLYDAIIVQTTKNPDLLTTLHECLRVADRTKAAHPSWAIPTSVELTTRIIELLVVLEDKDEKSNSNENLNRYGLPLISLMENLMLHGFFTEKNCENYRSQSPTEIRVIRQFEIGMNYLMEFSSDAPDNSTTVHKIIGISSAV